MPVRVGIGLAGRSPVFRATLPRPQRPGLVEVADIERGDPLAATLTFQKAVGLQQINTILVFILNRQPP